MRKISIILLSVLSITAWSQTNTYSPYSRYGVGDLSRQGSTSNKGMGGAGIALRLPNTINFTNPASYTSQDTLSFIFDFGMYSNYTKYNTSAEKGEDFRASLDHIVIGFPVSKWWKTSIGLVPYSRMGYNLYNPGPYLFDYYYKGTGGVNKFYFGNGFKIGNLSAGVNLNILFGTLEQTHSYQNINEGMGYVFPTEKYTRQALRSTSLTLGLQYEIKMSDDVRMVLGGVFENKSRLISKNSLLISNRYSLIDTVINPFQGAPYGQRSMIDTINYYDNKRVENHIPVMYGGGVSLIFKNKLVVTADYSQQNWSKFESLNDSLSDSRNLNFGVQFTPDEKAIRSYWKRINFRAGFYFNDTYLKINGQQIKDYGLSLGLRLPFKGNKSAIQLSYEYGKRGTTDYNLIEENYHLVNLSISLYDFWFVKSKFD